MKFSTAKKIAILLGSAAILAISTYFFLDAKDMMIPALAIVIKPFMMVTLIPLVLLLAAMLMADNKEDKEEKRITGNVLKRAAVLLAAVLCYKLITSYFSK
ncbi:hypothetical protein MHZ95_14510 [Sporosarcina sp. ACRSM]|uniref:hypothetical protein n=1 Tax=Sporosarcina sp. ACRSM TaxID=2918216 RepID=UPI001EF58ECA|nr:hypothetical protein [Sporosarcina sp. ACRSM]MCG7336479.1 hypothetical protein [Sporosarcina sp. ACRSM]